MIHVPSSMPRCSLRHLDDADPLSRAATNVGQPRGSSLWRRCVGTMVAWLAIPRWPSFYFGGITILAYRHRHQPDICRGELWNGQGESTLAAHHGP